MPLYPLWIKTSYVLFNSPALDVLISSLTIFSIFGLCHALTKNQSISLLSCLMYAVYPFSIYYASSGLTESLFTFLMITGLYFTYKGNNITASIFLILSCLVRPSLEMIFPAVIFLTSYLVHNYNIITSIKNVIYYYLLYVVLFAPWWIYNYNQYGQFVRLNYGSGIALYEGNNVNNINGGPYSMNGSNGIYDEGDSPAAINEKLTRAAVNYISDDPLRFVQLSFKKFLRFWNPMPNHENYRSSIFSIISLISVLPLFILSIIYFVRNTKRANAMVLPLILIICFLTAIHMVTVASIRYRYPIEPILIIFSAIALSGLLQRWTRYSL